MHNPVTTAPSIESILARCPEIPSLPVAATRVVELTLNSDVGANEIAQVLGQDPALAARVLRLANSAFYGMNRQVATLKDAVVVLGLKTVRELAIVAGALPWLKKPVKGYALEPGALLAHSTSLAVGAQNIARMARLKIADQAYVAGLMADIGKLVMSQSIDDRLAEMVTLGLEAGMTFDEVERRVVGFDHSQIGESLTHSWSLPDPIVAAVRFHHAPQEATEEHQSIVDCVHVADYLAMVCGFGLGGDGLSYAFDEGALMRLGISADTIDSAVDEFVIAFEAQESIIKELSQA